MKVKRKSNSVKVRPLKKAIKIKRKSSGVEGESTVSKALKNVKIVLEEKTANSTKRVSTLRAKSRSHKPIKKIIKTKTERARGVVYLGHIPHGFYEEQMKGYFKQFGNVTRVRVSRSKKTGRSRGYGYIEFEQPAVAKIAADTMNNYLMCGRLLKATYIPPEKQHTRFFAGTPWTSEIYPKLTNRNATNTLRNRRTKKQKSFVQSTEAKLSALEQTLKDKGIDLTFVPSDMKA